MWLLRTPPRINPKNNDKRAAMVSLIIVVMMALTLQLHWHLTSATVDTATQHVGTKSMLTSKGMKDGQKNNEHSSSSSRSNPHNHQQQPQQQRIPNSASSFEGQTNACVEAKHDVLLVGNRPVGTYLCSYFPGATPISGGCKIRCSPRFDKSIEAGLDTNFTCTVLSMGSPSQLRSADIVVNHHGPVPVKYAPLEPVLTVFYSGESNASEGKKALHSYQTKYDIPISFHTHRPLYFTWTNRFLEDFRRVLARSAQVQWPEWSERRNAVAIFVSRCKKGGRESVIAALAQHYPVHSFGKCHRTHMVDKEFPKCAALTGGRYPQKLCVLQQYKYVLALDNSRELDYVTEKVYHALLSGAVPIYDGAPNANDYLPGGWDSVVRLNDFSKTDGGAVDYERLAKTLRELEQERNPSLQTLKGWTRARSEEDWGAKFVSHLHHEEPTCELCDMARWKRCSVPL